MTTDKPTPKPTEWKRIPKPPAPPTCDLCTSRAVWRHRHGGLRCAKCPRPERKR
jgi:hypothetical protein